MSIALRNNGNTVTNGTAGTSVTVNRPTDTTNGDFLFAFIAETGTGSVTAPAGWTLVGSQASGTAVTLACYRKTASSEPASWTWTLGASVRNWGWVGAFTGVDTSDPVVEADGGARTSTDTVFTTDEAQAFHLDVPYGLSAVAAVRAAAGSATNWSSDETERYDGGTNGGAGTDITGAVTDTTDVGEWGAHTNTFTASLEQANAALWAVTLRPDHTDYDGGLITPVVEAAFGADPDGDPDSWSWTDITSDVRPPVQITVGRNDEAGTAQATSVTFGLNNSTGTYTPGNPTSTRYPDVVRGLPVRVKVPYGYDAPNVRATAFVDGLAPRWDATAGFSTVAVSASGRLRRLERSGVPLRSPIYRSVVGLAETYAVGATAYWPCEDGTNSAKVASAYFGGPDGEPNLVSFASDSTCDGSAPLPTFPAGSQLICPVPRYTNNSKFGITFVAKVGTNVSTTSTLIEVHTTGTARIWRILIEAGSPDTVAVKATDSDAVQILLDSMELPEDSWYGQWQLHTLNLTQSGSDIAYYHNCGTLSQDGTLASRTLGTVKRVVVRGSATLEGFALGHIVVHTASDWIPGSTPVLDPEAVEGWAGEQAWARFDRICAEDGVGGYTVYRSADANVYDNPSGRMGPQPIATLANVLRDCETVDQGLLHDGDRAGRLTFTTRGSRYNTTPAITLAADDSDIDAAGGNPAFEPAFDDQRIVNDVTATRTGGSSARYEDTTSIGVEGRQPGNLSVNAYNDAHLYEMAGWQASLGTVPGMRYPTIGINLRSQPGLLPSWLYVHPGDRLKITGPPSQHAPDDIDLRVEGYTETIAADTWRVVANCSPGAPYNVAEVDDDDLGKADTAGCVLFEDLTSGETTVDVATTTGPRWTTDAAECPFDIRVGGEVMTVSAVGEHTWSFVNTGTAAHANNASVTPALPASVTTGDLLLVFAAIRTTTATVNTPTDYTQIWSFGNVALFGKRHDGSESDPTVTVTGGSAGADVSAQTCAFRTALGTFNSVANLLAMAEQTTAATAVQDINYPALRLGSEHPNSIILYLGWKQDDWTSVASPGTEIGEPDTTTGNDQGIVWARTIQTAAAHVAAGAFTVTGGATAVNSGAVLALRNDVQTLTVTRAVNGVTKTHSTGAAVSLDTPAVAAL